ncbi:MAG: anaerobic ribonucleoside-triphosphate reductase activating protein [Actinobacteria bacterium]|nr:anaerobic ribonucleoside-triphosphate reductase activating protein [Actinomycetota bacterium]
MLDWEGMLASTIFLPRCNFRCPYCQNPELVLNPESLDSVPYSVLHEFFADRAGWIEGICITGGEPCLHEDLPELCSKLKGEGIGVKLDTNGSFPDMLGTLINDKLIDYVAMDVKAPLETTAYRNSSGNKRDDLVQLIDKSIDIIMSSGIKHEFRTTVVPMIHSPSEIEKIAMRIRGAQKYYLQYFSPGTTLDSRYSSLKPFTEDDMNTMLDAALKHFPGSSLRGASAGMDQ